MRELSCVTSQDVVLLRQLILRRIVAECSQTEVKGVKIHCLKVDGFG
jgi:hypothetical protein